MSQAEFRVLCKNNKFQNSIIPLFQNGLNLIWRFWTQLSTQPNKQVREGANLSQRKPKTQQYVQIVIDRINIKVACNYNFIAIFKDFFFNLI